MRKHWLLLAVGLVVAVLALGAVGCSDDDDDGGEATTEPTSAATVADTTPTAEATQTGNESAVCSDLADLGHGADYTGYGPVRPELIGREHSARHMPTYRRRPAP